MLFNQILAVLAIILLDCAVVIHTFAVLAVIALAWLGVIQTLAIISYYIASLC